MLDRTLVAVVSAVLLVALLAGMLDLLLPLFRRAEFDLLCRTALLRMDALGGLPQEERASLSASLEAAGFRDVSVTAGEGVPFGAPLLLEVRAALTVRRIGAGFREREEVKRLWFRKETVCRRIATYAEEDR
jgi:hypothetical protein